LLVEYFVGRYAKAAGKTIRHISKRTLEQLTAYDWPGNIRELRNIVERAVILRETDTFFVDESWLKRESAESRQSSAESRQSREGLSTLSDREVEMIEFWLTAMAAFPELQVRLPNWAFRDKRLSRKSDVWESRSTGNVNPPNWDGSRFRQAAPAIRFSFRRPSCYESGYAYRLRPQYSGP
jgi:transcriptional regulator with AAA-type ATPase domain